MPVKAVEEPKRITHRSPEDVQRELNILVQYQDYVSKKLAEVRAELA